MAASPTKRVEFDGRETLRRVQERNALSEDEAIELGVRAVHASPARAPGRRLKRLVVDARTLVSGVASRGHRLPQAYR